MAGGDVLGILSSDSSAQASASGESIEPKLMDLIISVRKDIRAQKLWALSDKIRDELKGAGVVLEDGKEGTHWKRSI
jgi:cysteinyl-tRNA synthetase